MRKTKTRKRVTKKRRTKPKKKGLLVIFKPFTTKRKKKISWF